MKKIFAWRVRHAKVRKKNGAYGPYQTLERKPIAVPPRTQLINNRSSAQDIREGAQGAQKLKPRLAGRGAININSGGAHAPRIRGVKRPHVTRARVHSQIVKVRDEGQT